MILQIKNLTVTHKKDLRVLIEGLSFALNDSDRAVIIGEEGNGKSTLLKLIADPREAEEYVSYTGQIIRGARAFLICRSSVRSNNFLCVFFNSSFQTAFRPRRYHRRFAPSGCPPRL